MAKLKVDEWFELIEQAERYKTEFGHSEKWETYRNYYRGDFPGATLTDGTSTPILPFNITFSMASTTIPSVYLRNPYINVSPRYASAGTNTGIEIQSKINEAVANWLMQEMGIKKSMRSGALDGFLCNRAIWKVGYDSQYGYTPHDQLIEFGGMEASTEPDESGQTDKKGNKVEHNANVKPGMPWCMRVDPDMFFVPFGVKSLEECEWVSHSILRPTKDVAVDPKYTNVSGIAGDYIDRVLLNQNKQSILTEMSRHIDITEIHEIRDARNKMIYALMSGDDGGTFIRDEVDELQVDGLPFVSAFFNEDPSYFWGPPDAKIMEPQQLEMNETNTQAMFHRRIALLKFFYDLHKIAPEEVAKILDGTVMPGIAVDGNPSEAFAMLQPHIPPDLVAWNNQQESQVRSLLGHSRAQTGEGTSKRQTKGESEIIQMGSDSRMVMKRDAMATALQEIMRKSMQLCAKFWTTDKVIQVVGYDGARYWVKYNNEQLQGEYTMKVDVESMSPVTKNMKRKDLISLVQALASNPRANLDYLLRQLLREFEWIDAMKVLPEAPETADGQAMTSQEFMGQQQGMLNKPGELKSRAANTASALSGLIK